jgi:hypothetical protein
MAEKGAAKRTTDGGGGLAGTFAELISRVGAGSSADSFRAGAETEGRKYDERNERPLERGVNGPVLIRHDIHLQKLPPIESTARIRF